MKPQAHQHDQRVQCQSDGSSDRGLVEGRGQVQQAQEGNLQVETLTHHSSALSYVHHQGLLVVQDGVQEGHLPDSVSVRRGGQVRQEGTQSVLSVLISLKSDPPYI